MRTFGLPASAFQDRAGEAARAVFYDPSVDHGWIDEPDAIAGTLAVRGGYRALDAAALDAWLAARAEEGADGCILVNLHGPAIARTAELQAFMRAGGRLVWAGFPPGALAPAFIDLEPHDRTPVETTEAGVAWGYPDRPRPGHQGLLAAKDAGVVLVRQGAYAVSFFLNRDPGKPLGGLLKLGRHGLSADWGTLSEVMRVAAHGLGEPETEPLTQTAAKAPEPRSGEGVLVQSGSFTIDRAAALRKLSLFQLPDAELFLLPWARAAAAAGARRLSIERGAWSVKLSHDGRPLARERLADPFGALFSGEEDAAGVQAAIGALAALRTGPALVRLESGGRAALMDGIGAVRAGPAGGHLTVLAVRWPAWRSSPLVARRAVSKLVAACAPDRFELTVDGSRVVPPSPEPSEDFPRRPFASGPTRGVVRAGPPFRMASRFEVFCLGVRVEQVQMWTWPCAIEGWLDCDRLTLSLSQTAIVRDEAFDPAVSALTRPGLELLASAAAEVGPLMQKAARLVHDRGLEAQWRRLLTYPHRRHPDDILINLSLPLGGEDRALLSRAARLGWWVRSNAGAAPDTPLYFSADGGTLTFRRIRELAAEKGQVRVCHRKRTGPDAKDILWLVSSGDIRISEGIGERPQYLVGGHWG